MPNHDVRAVANWFWHTARREGEWLSNMKLQKLPYIAYGVGLAHLKQRLIKPDQAPRAWQYGPVFPDLYYSLRQYGNGAVIAPICQYSGDAYRTATGSLGPEIRGNFTPEEEKILQDIWNTFGKHSAYELSALTHRPGTPWTKTFMDTGNGSIIADDVIEDYYRDHPNEEKLLNA